MDEDTNVKPDEEAEEQVESQEKTPTETTEETVPTEEQSEEREETSEDINLDDYAKERYQAPQQQNNQSYVDEIAKELQQLPTDELGNADGQAVAEWFSNKLSEVSSRAEQVAIKRAEEVFMSNTAERVQQEQLIKQYPEITKDKETLDAVFDLRDAAALRGQNLTLMEAAKKLDKLRQQGKAEGVQSNTRRTTVQAAAHLETSATKGNPTSENQRLAGQAVYGSGNEAKVARQEFLKQFVQNEIKEGRIQP